MGYRDAPPRDAKSTIVHGPFPIGLAQLALAVVALTIATLFATMTFDDARLDCDRAADVCRYRESRLFQRIDQFRLSDIQAVTVDVMRHAKGGGTGVPCLTLPSGQLRLKDTALDEANDFAHRLRADLNRRSAKVGLDLRADRGGEIPAVVFTAAMLLALFFALRRTGRVTMGLDGSALRVERTFFGLPVSSRVLDLIGVDDVEVEWERAERDAKRLTPPRTYGRLVLVRGAEREPLTSVTFPGYRLHLAAAELLRAALALPPRSPAAEALQAERARQFMPAPLAGGAGLMIGVVWMGIAGGGLVGFVVSFGGLAVLGVMGPVVGPLVAAGMLLGAVLGAAAAVAFTRASMR
jgi:hypothetical protein